MVFSKMLVPDTDRFLLKLHILLYMHCGKSSPIKDSLALTVATPRINAHTCKDLPKSTI